MQYPYSLLLLIPLLVLCVAQDEMRGWNKAMGLWGKRSAGLVVAPEEYAELPKRSEQSWQKLNTMWGKRSAVPADWEKRGNWQAANGLWGRRK